MNLTVTNIGRNDTTDGLNIVNILFLTQVIHIPGIIIVNIFVLVTFGLVKALRTPDNYVIATLATADLMNGAIGVPLTVINHAKPEFFSSSITRCFIFAGPQAFLWAYPLSMLMVLIIERYAVICHKRWYDATVTCSFIFNFAMGIVFLDVIIYLVVLSYAVLYHFNRDPLNCSVKAAPKWISIPGVLLLLIKLLISITCSVSVAVVLWRSVKRCHVRGVYNDPHYQDMKAKSIKTTLLMFLFVIPWLPTVIAGLVLTSDDPTVFHGIAGHFRNLNSSVNSLVYAFSRKHYKNAFMYMIRNRPCVWGLLPTVLRNMSKEEQKMKLSNSSGQVETWEISTSQQKEQKEEEPQQQQQSLLIPELPEKRDSLNTITGDVIGPRKNRYFSIKSDDSFEPRKKRRFSNKTDDSLDSFDSCFSGSDSSDDSQNSQGSNRSAGNSKQTIKYQ